MSSHDDHIALEDDRDLGGLTAMSYSLAAGLASAGSAGLITGDVKAAAVSGLIGAGFTAIPALARQRHEMHELERNPWILRSAFAAAVIATSALAFSLKDDITTPEVRLDPIEVTAPAAPALLSPEGLTPNQG